jgi:hypothetical protein
MGITRNLEAALRHIRHEHHPRILWVDAVCINQGDISKRGHQVRLMRSIYKNATKVLIWIGEDSQFIYKGSSNRPISTAYLAFQIFDAIFDYMNVKYATFTGVRELTTTTKGAKPTWKKEAERRAQEARERWIRPIYNDTWRTLEEFFSSR